MAPLIPRMIWVVLNIAGDVIAEYEYAKRAEADAHAAKLIDETGKTYYVQPKKSVFSLRKDY